jgi:hypothetical protein
MFSYQNSSITDNNDSKEVILPIAELESDETHHSDDLLPFSEHTSIQLSTTTTRLQQAFKTLEKAAEETKRAEELIEQKISYPRYNGWDFNPAHWRGDFLGNPKHKKSAILIVGILVGLFSAVNWISSLTSDSELQKSEEADTAKIAMWISIALLTVVALLKYFVRLEQKEMRTLGRFEPDISEMEPLLPAEVKQIQSTLNTADLQNVSINDASSGFDLRKASAALAQSHKSLNERTAIAQQVLAHNQKLQHRFFEALDDLEKKQVIDKKYFDKNIGLLIMDYAAEYPFRR